MKGKAQRERREECKRKRGVVRNVLIKEEMLGADGQGQVTLHSTHLPAPLQLATL